MALVASDAASDSALKTITIAVAWSPQAQEAYEECIQIPAGYTAAQTLKMIADCDWAHWPENASAWPIGVWGRACLPEHVLYEGDRLELYRPLRVDPKTARRQRFQQQGARAAGLFERRKAVAHSSIRAT